ncbi:Ig-like domain-containing protein [Streptomyces sp. 8L]|uniref:Ig-like domain-containing protein n=1 Tax=Streptomyces sp. 8L TaxID=2877242 RepID=UPI001CD5E333|nr:Ig-like domain-containing protein [Streptomyces sp. 8L]MCA1222362.1 Ig-like domain-containing protein [Streptomyces sp. 8L]
MAHRQPRRRGTFIAAAALAAVVGAAAPAAAADSSTALQVSPSTATVGSQVTLTATVSCPEDPTGGLGVTFFDGGDELDTVGLDSGGQATLNTSFSTTGTHTITAAYNGNQVGGEGCGASSTTATVTVTDSPTPPNPGPCLLLCAPSLGTSLINFSTGDINNNIGNEIAHNSLHIH